MNSTDIYTIVTERIIKQLETGTAPWRRTWSGGDIPRNLISKKSYRGVNAVLLSMCTYASPYWLTFNQAQTLGGHVRKGERSELIIFWKFSDDGNAEEGSQRTEKRRAPILKYYRVFNVEQCDGLEKHLPPRPEEKTFSLVEAAAQIIEGMPQAPDIRHDEPRAFYAPVRDFVNLPRPETYDILAVPGIDAVLIGPFDLSASMGLVGQISHTEVQEAIERVKLACLSKGTPLGIFAPDSQAANIQIQNGCTLIALGTDMMYMWQGAKQAIAEITRFHA